QDQVTPFGVIDGQSARKRPTVLCVRRALRASSRLGATRTMHMTTLNDDRDRADDPRAEDPRAETARGAPAYGVDAAGFETRGPSDECVDSDDATAQAEQLRARKLEALGTLAGGIAHDFHTALLSITGNTALAQRCLEPSHPARVFLDEVASAATRAGDLVQR